MELRFYREPFIDPAYPDMARLLFEGRTADGVSPDNADFYLYVWIHNNGLLHGFQAVLEDRVVLGYRAPSKKTFGRLGSDIINRGITQTESAEDREKLLSAIRHMENAHFPLLIGYIKTCAGGEAVEEEYRLAEGEMVLFASLIIKQ